MVCPVGGQYHCADLFHPAVSFGGVLSFPPVKDSFGGAFATLGSLSMQRF